MSVPSPAKPCKLVFGLLLAAGQDRGPVLTALQERFGPLDHVSRSQPFTFSNYYEKEMGAGIVRCFGSFERLVDPGELASIKLATNRIEAALAHGGSRRANIDPGLLSEERLVLATGKNYTHRIYLRDGIYADLTLIFKNGRYHPLPWTYPDYAAKQTRYLFGLLRGILLVQRGGAPPTHKTFLMEEMD
ncbi:protein of unknown function [Desulfacinum hydrothermale DSM 13146]|uniref:DUF4416 domain-containing protein n=1 Tax=Desulfacinum hydrothermale DSM 13146 TaxID=1121390 RepID=A0A1W1XTN3_9BACT|nr:DUF4416 family protein [Desulfacinum hydrothermale]SMC26891.1 protein of unknown function [Desulfacinum hydrothermale DSM 13146]